MKVEVVGKNGFEVTSSIISYATDKLQKVDQFVLGEAEEARVVCKVYKDHHKVEITIPTKGLILRSEVNDVDMYAAIDKSVDKLMQQVRKFKTRSKSKMGKEGIKESYAENSVDLESLEKEVLAKQLVKNKSVELKPMSIDEALEQMDLLGHSFFIFLNNETQKVNVAYLREDGDYAVIEANI